MLKRLIVLFGIALIAGGGIAVADDAATEEEIAKLMEEILDLFSIVVFGLADFHGLFDWVYKGSTHIG